MLQGTYLDDSQVGHLQTMLDYVEKSIEGRQQAATGLESLVRQHGLLILFELSDLDNSGLVTADELNQLIEAVTHSYEQQSGLRTMSSSEETALRRSKARVLSGISVTVDIEGKSELFNLGELDRDQFVNFFMADYNGGMSDMRCSPLLARAGEIPLWGRCAVTCVCGVWDGRMKDYNEQMRSLITLAFRNGSGS